MAINFGSVANANSSNVTITSGSIDGTIVGGSTAAAGTFTTLTETGALYVHSTTITASYTVIATDSIILVNNNPGAALTVTLPAAPTSNRTLRVKDLFGNAASFNIVIAGNGKTIDGASSLTLTTNYASVDLMYNGTSWSTFMVASGSGGGGSVSPATVAPLMDGSAAVGISLLYARQDHVHPVDTSRATLASPTFTGVPAAPTATVGTNTTQIATTAFVTAAVGSGGTYNPAAVAITGGTIDNTAIGNTTASSGKFVTLSATGRTTLASLQVGTHIVTSGASYTVLSTDYVVIVNKATGSATGLTLPSSPATGMMLVIKDGKGDCSVNAITITPAAGTIDGAATLVMNANYASVTLVYNATEWNIM